MSKTVVSVIAFDLNFSKGITMDEMFHWMVLEENNLIKANGYSSQIISQIHEGYIFGTLIAYKGDKSFLTTLKGDKGLSIKRILLSENQNSTQASIFCIEPTSQSGMFFSYHGGVSPTSFANTLKKIHDKLRLSKTREQKKEKSGAKNKGEELTGEFSLVVKFTQLDMDTLLEQFSNVSSMEVCLGPAIEPESMFRPFQSLARGFKTVVDLDGNQSPDGKIQAIRSFYNSIKEKKAIKSFKVAGRAIAGEKLSSQIGENLNHFGRMYLDDYITLLPSDEDVWDDFIKCKATEKLLETVKKNVAVIPPPKSVESWKTMQNKKDIPQSQES